MQTRTAHLPQCCFQGWASKELCVGQAPENPSMAPLLDAILEHVPPPPGDPQGQFAMLVTMTERDSFLGRVATGRIASGQVKVGDKIKVLRHSGELVQLCMDSVQLCIDSVPLLCSPWHLGP